MQSTPSNLSLPRALEVAGVFLKLGVIGFGGPAAHVALFRDEVVKRRKWVDDAQFLDLLGATNLIPGPNSTEMAIHLGYLRAGWLGLVLGGAGFILPAMLIVIILAWVYSRYGSVPQAAWLLYGIKPVIIAIILQALWGLLPKALADLPARLAGALALGVYFLNTNPLLVLVACGLGVMLLRQGRTSLKSALPAGLVGLPALLASSAVPFSLWGLFAVFLKVGAVLYGSGYVLLAFLRADLVVRLGWLSDAQLLDAIAIGQVTPGPVFTTATFIGYQLAGLPGALLSTLGIFLPSFVFVAVSNPLIPRLRASTWARSLLDGVNAASMGLMAAVTLQLARVSLVDPLTVLLGAAAALLLFRWHFNSTWLIAAGALLGLAASLLH